MAAPDQVSGPSHADATNAINSHAHVVDPSTSHSNGESSSASTAGPSRRRSRADVDNSMEGHSRRATSPDVALSRNSSPSRAESNAHLDIANYPTPSLLRMLASLLQQIASANDHLRTEQDEEAAGGGVEVMQQDPPADSVSASGSTQSRGSIAHPSPTTELFHDDPPQADLVTGDRLFTASKVSLSHPSSILSFHARHVPSISIESYLLRILKYCPTTNEVFLGLLVYFDRMSKLGTAAGVGGTSAAVGPRGFAIDSYNVHRLIIAGVTVASKFFSDVFYTNSRYAKVGGLPPHELNQLELQFLLLNNFTLMIPTEEMQKYGDRLIAYWQARDEPVAEPDTKRRERTEANAMVVDTQPQPPAPVEGQTSSSSSTSSQATPIAQASATVPTTPASGASNLSRSASLPRHPPPSDPPVAPRGRERDHPTVSFSSSSMAPAASTASVASGF